VLVLVLIPIVTGCYGNFAATQVIYRLNSVMPGRLLETVTMWVFVVVPVYPIAAVLDLFIFNLVESLTGVPLDVASTVERDGITYACLPVGDGTGADVTVSREGEVLMHVSLVRTADGGLEVRGRDGQLMGKALRTAEGAIRLCDASGLTVGTISAEQLAGAR
jgi:hypothetical protein